MLDKATEPRDIEKDKDALDMAANALELMGPSAVSVVKLMDLAFHYITQYEAQQARIAKLEKYNARLLAAVPDEVLDELKALEDT